MRSRVPVVGIMLGLAAVTAYGDDVATTSSAASVATASVEAPAAPLAEIAAAADPVVTDIIVLTVDKASLKAELRTYPEDPTKAQTLKSFRIAIGKAEGDKLVEGDNKTPEGVYFAQSHIPGMKLPEKYGAMAIPIDFPNPMDMIHKKTGHGIWLHGVDRDQRIEEAKVTEGCVAFYNSDIDRLGSWLKSHQGVVVIADDASKLNDQTEVAAVKALTDDWMKAWQERRIDGYMAHYAEDFRFERHDVKSYRDYKDRVFKSYKEMTVAYDNLRVIVHPKYAVSFFNQDFRGDDRFVSIGRKTLYWEKQASGGWRIKREIFENRRFEQVKLTAAELALLSDPGSGISSDKEKKAPNL